MHERDTPKFGPESDDFGPSSAKCEPSSNNFEPSSAKSGKSAQLRPKLGQIWSLQESRMSVTMWSKLVKLRPLILGQNRTNLAQCLSKPVDFGRSRPKSGRSRPKLVEFCPGLADIGPNLAEFGPALAEIAQHTSQHVSNIAEHGPGCVAVNVGRIGRNIAATLVDTV